VPARRRGLDNERLALLRRLEGWLEWPMVALGLVWLVLLVVELVWGLSALLEALGTLIWIAFVLDFAVRLLLAPRKLAFIRGNWLTAVSLLVPALRLVRFARLVRLLRAARTVRGLRLLRVVGALNRGMRALGASLGRRGFGYVTALTAAVTLAGGAAMYAFERDVPDGGLGDYGAALWWTAMIMTTLGSDYWPRSAEGRVLCLFLALYAFAVFGYVTATLATFFIGRDAGSGNAELAGARSIETLRTEVAALRAEFRTLSLELRERRRGAPDPEAQAPSHGADGTPSDETRTRGRPRDD